MLVPLKNVAGEQVGEIELSNAVFAAPVSKSLMHQALVRQLANARLGTHDTKARWEVSGGGKKPWRQKGTGRARQGSIRASQWIGGGTVFGPTPRKYTQSLNKKMQRAALRSALSVKAAAGQIVVVDEVTVAEAKTKQMVRVLSNLGASERSVLMVLAEKSEPIWRSTNNLPQVKTVISGYINVRDLLGHETILLDRNALDYIEVWLGSDISSKAQNNDQVGVQEIAPTSPGTAQAAPAPTPEVATAPAAEPDQTPAQSASADDDHAAATAAQPEAEE
jgi:large subunit ribosomal protein L4